MFLAPIRRLLGSTPCSCCGEYHHSGIHSARTSHAGDANNVIPYVVEAADGKHCCIELQLTLQKSMRESESERGDAAYNQPGGNNSQRINNEQYDATSTAGVSNAGGVSTIMGCLPVGIGMVAISAST